MLAERDGVIRTARGLELAGGRASGSATSAALAADFPLSALAPAWRADVPEGTRFDLDLAFSTDGISWEPWLPITRDPHAAPRPFLPDGRRNPHHGAVIGTLVTHGTRRFAHYRFRIRFGRDGAGASPALADLRFTYFDSTSTTSTD